MSRIKLHSPYLVLIISSFVALLFVLSVAVKQRKQEGLTMNAAVTNGLNRFYAEFLTSKAPARGVSLHYSSEDLRAVLAAHPKMFPSFLKPDQFEFPNSVDIPSSNVVLRIRDGTGAGAGIILDGHGNIRRKEIGSQAGISKDQVIEIAKQEARRYGWKVIEVKDAQLIKGHWRVDLQRQPVTPGGHATVEISLTGEIIRWLGGA